MRASLAALLLLSAAASADTVITEGTALSVDAASDGRIAFDLLGGLWILPPRASEAQVVELGGLLVREPRWSPDGSQIAFQTVVDNRERIVIVAPDGSDPAILNDASSDPASDDRDPAWHPRDRRISAASRESAEDDFDLWDIDIESGLRWRLTRHPGNETDPEWSADGRDLVFVREFEGRWYLVVRRFGRDEEVLLESGERLSSPAWRPDGSLLTYLRHGESVTIQMLILSEPRLERTLVSDRDVFDSPVAWVDRQRMVYAANGAIRRRDFNSWIPRNVPFRAALPEPQPVEFERPPVELLESPLQRWVLRVSRALASDGTRFERDIDIVIDGGRIESVGPAREHGDLVLVDMGNTYAIPGLVDVDVSLMADADTTLGPLLLSLGITTVVSDHPDRRTLNTDWSGARLPGPRILPSAMMGPLQRLADGGLVLSEHLHTGVTAIDVRRSPSGRQYSDVQAGQSESRYTWLSAQADDETPGLDALRSLRQFALAGDPVDTHVVSAAAPPKSAPVLIASAGNGLPPGLATLAELKALAATGRSPEKLLRAATIAPADALGLSDRIGTLQSGAWADIVLLAADPLESADAYLTVIAVVRNGRFFSAAGLVDKAR